MSVLFDLIVGWIVRGGREGPIRRRPGSASALRTLDERFARGEIDEAEYTKRRDLLTQR